MLYIKLHKIVVAIIHALSCTCKSYCISYESSWAQLSCKVPGPGEEPSDALSPLSARSFELFLHGGQGGHVRLECLLASWVEVIGSDQIWKIIRHSKTRWYTQSIHCINRYIHNSAYSTCYNAPPLFIFDLFVCGCVCVCVSVKRLNRR